MQVPQIRSFGLSRTHIAKVVVIFCTVTMLVSGCGGSGAGGVGGGGVYGTTGSGAGSGPTSLSIAESALNGVAFQGAAPSVAQMAPIAANFKAAFLLAPTNADAATGYAVSEAALDGLMIEQSYPLVSSPTTPSTALQAHTLYKAKPLQLSSVAQMLVLWQVPSVLAQGVPFTVNVSDVTPFPAVNAVGVNAVSSATTPVKVQQNYVKLDADLLSIENALAVSMRNSAYSYTLKDTSDATKTRALGLAELQALDSFVQLLRSLLNAGLMYSADDSNALNSGALAQDVFISQLSTPGTAILQSQYAPQSPYLHLETDGQTRSSNVQSELVASANNMTASIEQINARGTGPYILDPAASGLQAELGSVSSELQRCQTFFTRIQGATVTIDNSTFSTLVDLPGFMTRPPSTLYSVLPILTTGIDSANNTKDFYTATSAYSDPTFGALFPDGIPVNTVFVPAMVNPLDVSPTLTVKNVAQYFTRTDISF